MSPNDQVTIRNDVANIFGVEYGHEGDGREQEEGCRVVRLNLETIPGPLSVNTHGEQPRCTPRFGVGFPSTSRASHQPTQLCFTPSKFPMCATHGGGLLAYGGVASS